LFSCNQQQLVQKSRISVHISAKICSIVANRCPEAMFFKYHFWVTSQFRIVRQSLIRTGVPWEPDWNSVKRTGWPALRNDLKSAVCCSAE
jgi:hypothetical protein